MAYPSGVGSPPPQVAQAYPSPGGYGGAPGAYEQQPQYVGYGQQQPLPYPYGYGAASPPPNYGYGGQPPQRTVYVEERRRRSGRRERKRERRRGRRGRRERK